MSVFEMRHYFSRGKKKKAKCTLVQALRLCTGRTAHRGNTGIALLFLDHSTRRSEGSASGPDRSLPPRKTRYPLYRNLVGPQGPTGIRSLDRPARSQSLYRLRRPAQLLGVGYVYFCLFIYFKIYWSAS